MIRFVVLCAMVCIACGDDDSGPAEDMAVGGAGLRESRPTLHELRQTMREGVVSAAVIEALRTSGGATHQRAAALLGATVHETPTRSPRDRDAGTDEPKPDNAGSRTARTSFDKAPPSRSRKIRGAPILQSLRMTRTTGGVALRLGTTAGGEGTVGQVSEPQRGLMRLVVRGRAASGLSSVRLKRGGVQITEVKSVGQSTIITLKLDPGWTLQRIRRNSSGATVHMRAP